MAEIAKAYVQIVPSAEGIKGELTNIMNGEGTSAGDAFSGSFSKILGKGAIVAAAGVVAKKVGETIRESVTKYADFQQLTGGVETLFGESASIVEQYAAEAYQTAGLSANQYMEQVTSFAASLVSSLGGDTQAASEMGNMAITDMADNVNKMGSEMRSVQDAYQGFAKQNYTMLDNLKLGYGGTKTEMERLLSDAEALKAKQGEVATYSIDSYADIVEAIHVVQTEMGITGTTAEEAASTISGSIGTAQAAWENLQTGIADGNADIDTLTVDLAESIITTVNNIVPAVEDAMGNIVKVVVGLPEAINKAEANIAIEGRFNEYVANYEDGSDRIRAAMQGVADEEARAANAGTLYAESLSGNIAQAEEVLSRIRKESGGAVWDAFTAGEMSAAEAARLLGTDVKTLRNEMQVSEMEIFQESVEETGEVLEEVSEEAKEAHDSIIDLASEAYNAKYSGDDLRETYEDLSSELDKLRETGDAADIMLAEAALASLNLAATNQELLSSYPGLVSAVADYGYNVSELSAWLIGNGITTEEWGSQVQSATNGIINNFQSMNTDLGLSLEEMAANLQANIEATAQWNSNMADLWAAAAASGQQGAMEFVQYMQDMGPAAATQVAAMAGDLEGTLATFAPMFADAADQGVLEVYNGIQQGIDPANTAGSEMMTGGLEGMESVTGFDVAGTSKAEEAAAGILAGSGEVQSAGISAMISGRAGAASVTGWDSIGLAAAQGIAAGITSGSGAIRDAAVSAAQAALSAAKAELDVNSPSKVFRDQVGLAIPEGIVAGIELGEPLVTGAMEAMARGSVEAFPLSAPDTPTPEGSYAVDQLGLMLQLLEEYMPALASREITLDGKAVVGELSPGIDRNLGRRQRSYARGRA